ncbi:hypothetical protein L249_0738, partial [Ophiocordyceps polyrhachis-furcata BCC 54312]
HTRGKHNGCVLFGVDFNNRESSERYWVARMMDGCERKGERGRCCESKHEFRLWDGTCSSLRMIGPVPATSRELLARRRSDEMNEGPLLYQMPDGGAILTSLGLQFLSSTA